MPLDMTLTKAQQMQLSACFSHAWCEEQVRNELLGHTSNKLWHFSCWLSPAGWYIVEGSAKNLSLPLPSHLSAAGVSAQVPALFIPGLPESPIAYRKTENRG